VLKIADENPERVWTEVDTDDGMDTVVVPGYHLVNREGYMITEVPLTDEDDERGLWVKF